MNTIVLAAGRIDYRNMAQGLTSSQLLTVVNGRPAISWVIGDLLKNTSDQLTLVLDAHDTEMVEFCRLRYAHHDRVKTCLVDSSPSVLHSLLAGIDALEPGYERHALRVNLGDTLLLEAPFSHKDSLYVSDFSYSSRNWCVVAVDGEGGLGSYYNKQSGLESPSYKAVVGRYEVSQPQTLAACVRKAILDGRRELSDVLEAYGSLHPLSPRQVAEASWIDFGHLEGLAKARTRLIESRVFNSLQLHPVLPEITKRSSKKQKIQQELFWYESLPSALQSITPRVLGHSDENNSATLRMEYYGYGTLAEKFIYFNLSESFWESTLTTMFRLVDLFRQHSGEVPAHEVFLEGMYVEKTFARLAELRAQSPSWQELLSRDKIEINQAEYAGLPKLEGFIRQRAQQLLDGAPLAIVHGDLCFNNILYDVSSGVVKLIDPRGEFGKQRTIYGDPRYDLAKLRHSFCGNYDCIVEGDFDVAENSPGQFQFAVYKDRQSERDHLFDRVASRHGYDPAQIRFLEGILFLSMIPLHQDSLNKQLAFFATAIRKLNACQRETQ